MWLQYALDKDNNLVSVGDVQRGKSNIRCPYCQGELTARKGKVKAHHFAHVNETCNQSIKNENIRLPLADGFELLVSGNRRFVQRSAAFKKVYFFIPFFALIDK